MVRFFWYHHLSSKYFHFFMLCLLRRNFVRSLLRHFHFNQVQDAPLTKDSLAVRISWSGTYCRWLDHSLIRRVNGVSISLSVSCMKLLLDVLRFFGTVWPCCGCLVSFTCPLSLSLSQHFSLWPGGQYRLVDTSYQYYSAVDILQWGDRNHSTLN